MAKPFLDLYPPVELPTFPPTWEDIERLALHYPCVYHGVAMVERGDWTREQALIMVVFALAESWRKLFQSEVDRRMLENVPMLLPGPLPGSPETTR